MTKLRLNLGPTLAWRLVITATLLAVGAWILAANRQTVAAALQTARGADMWWLGLSLVCMVGTFCVAAALYGALALHPLRYVQTLLIELAATFLNRLLPAGIGGLGLHGVYLHRRGHSGAEATVVVSVNNLLGIGAHMLLLLLLLILRPSTLHGLFARHHVHVSVGQITLVLLAMTVVALLPVVREPLLRFGGHLLASVRKIRPTKLLVAFGLALLITAGYTLMLFCAARSVGAELGLLPIFVVFSFGMLATTATPTPGGLVGTEAGLFAGFVAYGVPGATAGAAVLLFRLVTYWLPLLPGAVALQQARVRKLV